MFYAISFDTPMRPPMLSPMISPTLSPVRHYLSSKPCYAISYAISYAMLCMLHHISYASSYAISYPISYAPMFSYPPSTAHRVPPYLTPYPHSTPYSLSGTNLAYGPTHTYASAGTNLWYAPTRLASYASLGTYPKCSGRLVPLATCLRVSSTDCSTIQYCAVRDLVLSPRVFSTSTISSTNVRVWCYQVANLLKIASPGKMLRFCTRRDLASSSTAVCTARAITYSRDSSVVLTAQYPPSPYTRSTRRLCTESARVALYPFNVV
eukprot:721128-Rhodomonas_salina.1